MSAYDAMIVTGAERGWGVDLQLELACQYIENQGSNEAFYDFLAVVVEEENAQNDDWWDDSEMDKIVLASRVQDTRQIIGGEKEQ